MANKIWTNGGGDGLFATAGNWSPANEPTTGDNIIITRSNSAINCTGMTAAAFGTLDITPECTLAIGSTGAPLSGSFTDIRHRGRAAAKLYFTDTAVGVTNRIFIACEAGQDCAELSGALPFINVERGRVTVLAAATGLDRVIVGKINAPTSDAYMDIASTGTTAVLDVYAGLVICKSIITTANITGNGIMVRRSTAACATLNASNGGKVFYEGTGTITLAIAQGDGFIDCDKKYQDTPSSVPDERTGTLTITASMVLHGGKLIANSPQITKTAATVRWDEYAVPA